MRTIQRALLLLASVATGTALAADGIAFLTNVKGDVSIDGARASVLGELAKGQKLVLGKEAQASVMYIASGKEYVLRGPGDYEMKETELSAASGMPPITRATEWRASSKVLVQVAQTSAASVRMRSIPPPKPAAAERLVYPTQGAISTLQPTFRWVSAADKGEFSLSVVGQDKPVHQAKAGGNSYKVPGKLKPDTEYFWVVTNATGELGTGKFRTLPAETVQKIEKRKPTDKSEFSDRLLFALLLQEVGATQEAQEAYARLAQERADLPELAALAR